MDVASKTPDQKPPTEVEEKAHRRSFTTAYKLDVLRRADACGSKPGAINALLRREGLYSSHLANWRKQRAEGALNAAKPTKRGPVAKVPDARDRTIAEQQRQIARLTARAERAEALVELQKKVAALLGEPLLGEKGEKR